MTHRLAVRFALFATVAVLVLSAASRAGAGDFTTSPGLGFDPGNAGFSPRVPISGLARAASWFDPSRLHLSSTVSIGNNFGQGFNGAKSSNPFFLEGFDLNWRPTANSLFRIEMHDVRSPLQISDPWGNAYGYGD